MVSVQSWNKCLCDRNCAIDLQSHVETVRERTHKEHYYIIFTKLDNKSKVIVATVVDIFTFHMIKHHAVIISDNRFPIYLVKEDIFDFQIF